MKLDLNKFLAVALILLLSVFVILNFTKKKEKNIPVENNNDQEETIVQTYDDIVKDNESYAHLSLPRPVSFLGSFDFSKLSDSEVGVFRSVTIPKLYRYENGYETKKINGGLYIDQNKLKDSDKDSIVTMNYDMLYKKDEFYELKDSKTFNNINYNMYVDDIKFKDVYTKIFGPDSVYNKISFSYGNKSNDTMFYKYDPTIKGYYVGQDYNAFTPKSIVGTHEKIIKVTNTDNEIKIYSKVISYELTAKFNLDKTKYSEIFDLTLYNGIFGKKLVNTKNDLKQSVEKAFEKCNYQFVYVFKKQSDGNYYYY